MTSRIEATPTGHAINRNVTESHNWSEYDIFRCRGCCRQFEASPEGIRFLQTRSRNTIQLPSEVDVALQSHHACSLDISTLRTELAQLDRQRGDARCAVRDECTKRQMSLNDHPDVQWWTGKMNVKSAEIKRRETLLADYAATIRGLRRNVVNQPQQQRQHREEEEGEGFDMKWVVAGAVGIAIVVSTFIGINLNGKDLLFRKESDD